MTEKEKGKFEGNGSGCLWEVIRSKTGPHEYTLFTLLIIETDNF